MPKIITLDVETFPMIGAFWQLWETNPIWVDKPSIICCVSVKWYKGKQYTFALPDFKGYKVGHENPILLLRKLHAFIDEADIVLGQNHKRFDMKVINTEFLKYGLKPPSPYKMIDTLVEAKKHFRFASNKLDSMGEDLEEGRKLDHEGIKLWKRCMAGDMKAWNLMKRYNAQDVRLTERIYDRFIPWIDNHPAAKMKPKKWGECENCKSTHLQSRGYEWGKNIKYHRIICMSCGHWQKGEKI